MKPHKSVDQIAQGVFNGLFAKNCGIAAGGFQPGNDCANSGRGERKSEPMDWERAKEIATMGGCGLVALAILRRRGGVPMLRYEDGNATHAAVKIDGELIHLGDNEEDMQEVTIDELKRAIKEDFDVDRVDLQPGDIRRVVEKMEMWDTE